MESSQNMAILPITKLSKQTWDKSFQNLHLKHIRSNFPFKNDAFENRLHPYLNENITNFIIIYVQKYCYVI